MLDLLAYLDSFPFGSVYCIDIDTNGELDCSFTQLPFEALAWDAAELELKVAQKAARSRPEFLAAESASRTKHLCTTRVWSSLRFFRSGGERNSPLSSASTSLPFRSYLRRAEGARRMSQKGWGGG
jgi:hypothetical protein